MVITSEVNLAGTEAMVADPVIEVCDCEAELPSRELFTLRIDGPQLPLKLLNDFVYGAV